MPPLSMARWILVEHARRATTWAACALFLAAWPFALTLGQLGLTTRDGPLSTHAYEVAFLALLVGAARGILTLSRAGWFLGRAAPAHQLAAEAGGLLGASLPLLAAAWGPALLLAPDVSGAGTGRFILAVGLTTLHVGALALVALRLPAPPEVRALALVVAAWVVPALAAPGSDSVLPGSLGLTLQHLLDSARHGRLGLELGAGLAHRLGALLPITALVVSAWLLAIRAPNAHALRHPR